MMGPDGGWIEKLKELAKDADIHKDVFVWAITGALALLFGGLAWISRGVLGRMGRALAGLRTSSRLSKQLLAYEEQLDADTFRVQHSWMKEDQVLDDILVPVNVMLDAGVDQSSSSVE